MIIGDVTIDGMQIGLVEINLSSEIQHLPDYEGTLSKGDDGYIEHPGGNRLGHGHGFYPKDKGGNRLGHGHGFYPKKSGESKGSGQQESGGNYGRTNGGSGANYLGSAQSRSEGIDSGVNRNLTTVQTKAGPITVNRAAAPDMSGAINELVESGAPVGHIGSHADRNIAGTGRKSQHAYGGAMDLFNQSGRGIISREGLNWIKNNPEKWKEIKQRHNLVGGEEFGDIGHVEWGGPGYGERHYGGQAKYHGPRDGTITNKTTPGVPVRGSYFDDHSTASGLSAATTPGIALPSREGLGKMHEVTGPGGQKVMLRQIDVGPAQWTGRGIDISTPALEQMGYTKKNFPTDAPFIYHRVDPEPVKPTSDKSSDAGQPYNIATNVQEPNYDDERKPWMDAPNPKTTPPTGAEKKDPPSGIYPPTPGDNQEYPKGWNIPSDYNQG